MTDKYIGNGPCEFRWKPDKTGLRCRQWVCAALTALILFAGVASAEETSGKWLPQPPNLGDLKEKLLAYKNSGSYQHDLETVAAKAKTYLLLHVHDGPKPALVLDIDETSLSNWPRMIANDFGYFSDGPCNMLPKGPCGARAWELKAKDEAIAPTLALFRAARRVGVSVFFITGRDSAERAATVKNLHGAGYRGWSALMMTAPGVKLSSIEKFKAPQRAMIAAQGYTIIANMGDQPSDLAGGNPDDPDRQFLLPNPFYRVP